MNKRLFLKSTLLCNIFGLFSIIKSYAKDENLSILKSLW